MDEEGWFKLYENFWLCQGLAPHLCVVQGSTVFYVFSFIPEPSQLPLTSYKIERYNDKAEMHRVYFGAFQRLVYKPK